MNPKIACSNCGNMIDPSDKYCGSCGEKIEWKGSAPSPRPAGPAAPGSAGEIRCPLCGQMNNATSSSCGSCGGSLQSRSSPEAGRPAAKSSSPAKLPPLKILQSWKLTLGLGIVLVVTLVLMRTSRNEPLNSAESTSAHSTAAAQEIRNLQQTVDSNPGDAASILRLANLYHDVRLFPKAIAMYERYLELNPSNPDARVDLGTSYFELSFEDTTRKAECLGAAQDAMEKALTYAPRHQLALFNLGIIRFHTGDYQEALDSFRQCVAVDSTSDAGRKAKQFINQHSTIAPSS